ncbi:ABC transporter permease [Streptomyces triticiradicis]|uniref:ABC transporter permease n=1 Tax=Streptomyces triticiradicis TaxID=2651189 RepID=A0A7J5D2Q7_9ACTN|nr:ABC transporter permease [Streptomyces triticiradicis]KAB1977404.1 ABC transporter permease [Streptomyces triticiradicis]
MKMYRIELRRSPLLWFFPVLVTIDLAAVFGRSRWWIGVWPEASAAAQIPALFFAPVAGAAAAWAVGRAFRRGVSEQRGAAARASWKVELAQFSATLTYSLGAYTVGALAAAVVTFPDGGAGFLWPSYLLLGAGTIVACTAVGHAVASVWHSPFAVPVICGLSCFLFISAIGAPDALGLFVLSGSPARIIDLGPLAARLAFAISLALLAVCGLPWLRRKTLWKPSRASRAVNFGAGVAVLLSAVFVVTSGPVQDIRTAPTHPLCTSDAPRVCVWPEHRKYLQRISAMVKRLDSVPQTWIKMPDSFYEQGLRGETQSSDNPSSTPQAASESPSLRGFEILEGNTWFVSPTLASSIMQLSIPDRCQEWDPDEVDKLAQASFEIMTWLEYRANGPNGRQGINGGPPGVDFKAVEKISRAGEKNQERWVADRLKAIRETPCA